MYCIINIQTAGNGLIALNTSVKSMIEQKLGISNHFLNQYNFFNFYITGDHVAGTDEVSKDVLKARNSKGFIHKVKKNEILTWIYNGIKKSLIYIIYIYIYYFH